MNHRLFTSVFVLGLVATPLIWAEDRPPACQGGEAYEFAVQVSTDGGYTWSSDYGYAYVSGPPGCQVDIAVRTLMTVTSGQTQGWSFGVEHDPTLLQYYYGDLQVTSVTTYGTDTETVKNGGPPDVSKTSIRAGFNGFTQGVMIDTSQEITLAPTTAFVTSYACYSLTLPYYDGYYAVPFSFTHDLGDPEIRSIVTQEGQSNVVCAQNLTLYVHVSYYNPPPNGGCYYYSKGSAPTQSPTLDGRDNGPRGPASPGTDFVRGDADDNGDLDLTDAIFTLNHLFLGGAEPACLDACDSNDDEELDLSDPVFTLGYLFLGAAPIPPPYPDCGPDLTGTLGQGPDLTEEDLLDQLGCGTYGHCVQTDSDGDLLTDHFEINQLGTRSDVADTDGDNFTDGQEVLPTGVAGCDAGGVNIAMLNADPSVPDIYVEVDWMWKSVWDNHRPDIGVLEAVVLAFADNGISLHIDDGTIDGTVRGDPVQFPGSGGSRVTETEYVNDSNQINFWNLGSFWESFEDLKAAHFNSNRCDVFHYNLWVHKLFPADLLSSGLSQGIWTDDFLVSFGGDGWEAWPRFEREAGIFMHELGHNLGLRHGGASDLPVYKPNYRSVMSYRYSLTGIDVDCDGTGDGVISLSNEVLPSLNEMDLDERVGLGGPCAAHAIDWNKNCDDQDVGVQADVSCPGQFEYICDGVGGICGVADPCDGICCEFAGFNDWQAIRFDFQNSVNRVNPPNALAIDECAAGGAGGSVSIESPLKCISPQ